MKKSEKKEKKPNGFYIPFDLASDTELSWNQKIVYSLYHYFTFYGESRECTIPLNGVAKRLGMSESTLKSIRRFLRKNNYIQTNGGTKTTALIRFEGVKSNTPIDEVEIQQGGMESEYQGVENRTLDGKEIIPDGYRICAFEGADSVPIIKNNKENKDVIKTETTVVKRDSILPLVERIEIPEGKEAVKEQSSLRSGDGLNETLLQELKGCSTDEVAKRFDKFLVSIREEKFKGKEEMDEMCLRTFLHVIPSERVRDVFRKLYEVTKDILSRANFLPIDYCVAESDVAHLRKETSKRIKELQFILQDVGYDKNVVEEIANLLDEDLLDSWEKKDVLRFLDEVTANRA